MASNFDPQRCLSVRLKTPLWKGPVNQGVTQSLLGRYISSPERFRLRVIEGFSMPTEFLHRLEYGNMWHECEEAVSGGKSWQTQLKSYAQNLVNEYPMKGKEIDKWFRVCKVQFPVYLDYWKKNEDEKKRVAVSQEEEFRVPYKLPSGRTVLMLGKWDSVDRLPKVLWLKENKSKGEIHEGRIQKQLSFDLQTMFYVVALQEHYGERVGGVRYNVIRRPLSGGRHTIKVLKKDPKTKKPETLTAFYNRLGKRIKKEPEFFFHRWKVPLTRKDIKTFCVEFLHPVLDNLCDDYEWWEHCQLNKQDNVFDYIVRERLFPHHTRRHWRLPFGIFNPIANDRATPLDNYLLTGDTTGLVRNMQLFPELEMMRNGKGDKANSNKEASSKTTKRKNVKKKTKLRKHR